MQAKYEVRVLKNYSSLRQGTGAGFIQNNDWRYRNLDLPDGFSIDITYQVSKIEDISSRTAAYTKQFIIPDTRNNREVFDFINEPGTEPDYINDRFYQYGAWNFHHLQYLPNKKTKVIVTYNSDTILEGYLQMTSILKRNENNGYEIVIYSDEKDFYSAIENFNIDQMDWTDMDHVYSANNIISSWNNNQTGTQVYYPLIDYGNNWTTKNIRGLYVGDIKPPYFKLYDLKVGNFFPSTPVYMIFKKIFAGAGYKWKSEFLESEIFKNLYIPCNNTDLKKLDFNLSLYLSSGGNTVEPFIESRQFFVGRNAEETFTPAVVSTGFAVHNGSILFDNETTSPYNDKYNRWSTTNYEFTNRNDDAIYKSRFNIGLELYAISGYLSKNSNNYTAFAIYRQYDPTTGTQSTSWASGYGYPVPAFGEVGESVGPLSNSPTVGKGYFYVGGYTGVTQSYTTNDGTNIPDDYIKFGPLSNGQNGAVINFSTEWLDNSDIYHTALQPGEKVRVQMSVARSGVGAGILAPVRMRSNSYFKNEVSLDLIKNEKIDYINVVPKNVKMTDFVSSIFKKFNLYCEAIKGDEKTLLIEPRDQFYQTGNAEDWTQFVDIDGDIDIELLSDKSSKNINFKDKEDKDYYNTNYKDSRGTVYGEYNYVVDNDFASSNKDITTIFSPTPLVRVFRNTSLSNSNIVIPIIVKDLIPNVYDAVQAKMESNIRLLQRSTANIPFGPTSIEYMTFEGATFSNYPYIGDVDHPFTPTRSLNWGTPNGTYYQNDYYTSNNLVNTYYLNQLKEITDASSRLVTMDMYLPSYIIKDFSFTKNIFVELRDPNKNMGSAYYYKVTKISSYSPDGLKPCKVEMILSNYALQPKINFRTNAGGGGPIDTTPQQGPGGDTGFRMAPNTNNQTPSAMQVRQPLNSLVTNGTNNIPNGGVVSTGYGNNIYASNAIVAGNANIVTEDAAQSIVSGNNNIIHSSSFVMGNNNTVNPGLTNVLILGDNIIAQQSNVIYSSNPTIQYVNYVTAGIDNVIDPFNTNNINFISGGRDVVIDPFGDNIINSLSAGFDQIL